jgi:hypothetical protein
MAKATISRERPSRAALKRIWRSRERVSSA